MSHSFLKKEGGSAAATVTLPEPAAINPMPRELREHLEQLRLMLPVISNAVIALRRQNADCDADVAYDLIEQACEPLGYEIQRIECLLLPHATRRRQKEVPA
jgi:hypothetical protein